MSKRKNSEISTLLTSLKRLEKRIEILEKSSGLDVRDFYRDAVSILRINQEIVAELVKANDSLRVEISKLPLKINELISKIDELLSLIKAAAEEEISPKPKEEESGFSKRLDELIAYNKRLVENNQALIDTLEEIKRKLSTTSPFLKKPLIPKKPTI
ncbi:MAG TPA: hypothetical protein ENF38_00350 [Candidatus Aenigmarchaeota archaeon]|nr:hypothetical protein [Candidatus Aenigmarchaeota archaeon]